VKRFKFSLGCGVLLLATTPFHVTLERTMVGLSGFNFINYLLLGVLLAFMVLALARSLAEGNVLGVGSVLLAAAVMGYFFFVRRIFLNHAHFRLMLHLTEFFILGVILAKENKRQMSALPFVILLAAAFGCEWIQRLVPGMRFDFHDVWLNGIAGLIGLAVGYF